MTHYANRPFIVQWFLLGMVSLLFGSILVFEIYQDRLKQETKEREHLQAQARVIEENVGFLLQTANAVLQRILRDLPAWRNGTGYRPEASDSWDAYLVIPGIRTLLVTDAQGVVRLANRRELAQLNISHRDYFQVPRQHPDPDTLYLSPPFRSLLNVFVMNVSRAVIGTDGRFAGVVTLSFDPTYFETVMRSVLYAPDMQVTIAHGDGLLFLQVPQGEVADGAKPDREILHSTQGERLGVVSRIQPGHLQLDRPLFVAVSRLLHIVHAVWQRDAILHGALFLLMVLVSCIALLTIQIRIRRYCDHTRQAEAALEQSDRQQREILNHTPAIVFLKDLQGRYLFVNRQYETLFHITNQDVQGKTDFAVFPYEVASALQANDRLVLTRQTIMVEERLPQDDGVHVYIVVKFLLQEPDGHPHAVCGIATDITDRKQMEEALLRAKAEAMQASRTKSTFLAAMSHEIRTPMNAIIGMGDVLQETPLDADQKRCLQTMIHAGNTLMGLINDILDLSKIEAGQMEVERHPFDLPTLVEESAAVLRVGMQTRGLALRVQLADDMPRMVLGDAQRIKQVLFNLLDNASKFTHQGEVTLAVSGVDDSQVRFAVTDTGIGIPEDRLAAIFEPFVQAGGHHTFKRFGGTGLGLSICKQLITLMQGVIQVESRCGQGTTFTFVLPLERVLVQPEAVHPPHPDRFLPFTVHRAGLRILAVDDAEENLQLLDAFLKGTPHCVTKAADGAEAITLFQDNPFDLVLMDIQMPVMNGYEATRAMRAWEKEWDRPATPIIAFTAHAMKDVSDEVLAAGCNEVLTKPIRKKSLLSVLERY